MLTGERRPEVDWDLDALMNVLGLDASAGSHVLKAEDIEKGLILLGWKPPKAWRGPARQRKK